MNWFPETMSGPFETARGEFDLSPERQAYLQEAEAQYVKAIEQQDPEPITADPEPIKTNDFEIEAIEQGENVEVYPIKQQQTQVPEPIEVIDAPPTQPTEYFEMSIPILVPVIVGVALYAIFKGTE